VFTAFIFPREDCYRSSSSQGIGSTTSRPFANTRHAALSYDNFVRVVANQCPVGKLELVKRHCAVLADSVDQKLQSSISASKATHHYLGFKPVEMRTLMAPLRRSLNRFLKDIPLKEQYTFLPRFESLQQKEMDKFSKLFANLVFGQQSSRQSSPDAESSSVSNLAATTRTTDQKKRTPRATANERACSRSA